MAFLRKAADEDKAKPLFFEFACIIITKYWQEFVLLAQLKAPHAVTASVALDITPEPLAFYNNRMKYVAEPGGFEIMASNSSPDDDLQQATLRAVK